LEQSPDGDSCEGVNERSDFYGVFWGVTTVFGVAPYFKRTLGNPKSVTDLKPNSNELASTKYLDP